MAILISIKPEYVCKILNKEKILEIRTTCPTEWKKYLDGKTNIKPKPCKVYIYCTKGNKELRLFNEEICVSFKIPRTKTYSIAQQKAYTKFIEDESQSLNSKVVAEFTLNEIEKFECSSDAHNTLVFDRKSCLSIQQVRDYCNGQDLYAWHIDNLIIYDKPKELSDFEKFGSYKNIKNCPKKLNGYCNKGYGIKGNYVGCEKARLKKPPQSWYHVQEL